MYNVQVDLICSRGIYELSLIEDLLTDFEIWTMDPLRVLFYISVALIYIIAPATALGPLCGSELANSLAVVCAERGYYEQQPDIAVSPIVPRDVASTFLRSSSGGANHRQKRRPRTGKIVTECCENICTMAILESYCMKRTATEPPAHEPTTVREDNSFENVNREQERERTESAEVSTSRNNGGSSERRTDDATPATNIERPTVQNPTDTSKSNRSSKHDRRRGKNNPDSSRTSTSSSKKNRTSKQASREERRKNNSMERKASRELQRAISRERRQRLKQEKQQRKNDKKKRRRMESAERSRGTDRNTPAEDITPLVREALAEQTRRTRSRSSSSRERLAHTLRAEDDELRRIRARQPLSRPSHLQLPSAQTTHAQEALSHRRTRSVWQKIRDSVLRHFR